MSILLIEDNPITRKMLRLALESDGHAVVEAGDGAQALKEVALRPPDLLVLDYVLPDIDGLELLVQIRERVAAPHLPAVIVTGAVAVLEELGAHASLHTQVLAKPLEPSRLLEVVSVYLTPVEKRAHGRHVLVVDDDSFNARLAELRLRQIGYEVETAASGAEALAKAHARRPDAILSDVLMPVMDGFTLSSELRKDPVLADVPIILVSAAYVDEADRELARRMGANALVRRNPGLQDAVTALDQAIAKSGLVPALDLSEEIGRLHRERVQVQLERMTAQAMTLVRQAAIQASALTVMRGVTEILAEPRDVMNVMGDVLIQCLDAAGLSTGLLYVLENGGEPRLKTHFGVAFRNRPQAEACFGHPALLRSIVESRRPVALSARDHLADPAMREVVDRIGHASVLVVPFVVDGGSFGAVVLASDHQDLSDSAWMGFASNVAVEFDRTVALGQSLTRLRQMTENIHEVFWMTDATFEHVLYISPAYDRVFGHDREVLYDDPAPWYELVHPEDRPRISDVFAAGISGDVDVTYRIVHGDGTVRWIRTRAFPIADSSGVVYRCAGTSEDVTDRNRAEAERERRATQWQVLADAALAIGATRSRPEIGEVVTHSARRMFGANAVATILSAENGGVQAIRSHWLAEHFRDRRVEDLMPPNLERRAREGGRPVRATPAEAPSGKASLAVPLVGRTGTVFGVILALGNGEFAEDEEALGVQLAQIASQALENARLIEEVGSARERLETLSARLVRLQEEERRTIARELHDSAGQILIGLKFTLEAIERRGGGKDLVQLKDLVEQLLARVKDLSLNLRPPMLDDLGLVPTLLWHFERYRGQTGIDVQFHHQGVGPLSAATGITAFRIVQEALTNVTRHAEVREVIVDVQVSEGVLHVRVEDTGKGFDPESLPGHSSGLGGMRERAQLAGGRLSVESRPEAGTRILAELPVEE